MSLTTVTTILRLPQNASLADLFDLAQSKFGPALRSNLEEASIQTRTPFTTALQILRSRGVAVLPSAPVLSTQP